MKLKQLRELNHMTQRQAAEAIGCTQGNYSRYETGEREPSIDLLVRMAAAFGVSVDYLIGNADVDDMVLSTYAEYSTFSINVDFRFCGNKGRCADFFSLICLPQLLSVFINPHEQPPLS